MLTAVPSTLFAAAVAVHASSHTSAVSDLQPVNSGDDVHLMFGDCQGAMKWTLEQISDGSVGASFLSPLRP